MAFGIIPECCLASVRNERSASTESPRRLAHVALSAIGDVTKKTSHCGGKFLAADLAWRAQCCGIERANDAFNVS
jgi:hypothetical protein